MEVRGIFEIFFPHQPVKLSNNNKYSVKINDDSVLTSIFFYVAFSFFLTFVIKSSNEEQEICLGQFLDVTAMVTGLPTFYSSVW